MNSDWYRTEGDDLLLFLRIQPRASQEGFGEVLGNERKLRIKAPPVDGKANAYLIKYLARTLNIAKNRIHIESGHSARSKRVRISGPVRLPEALER